MRTFGIPQELIPVLRQVKTWTVMQKMKFCLLAVFAMSALITERASVLFSKAGQVIGETLPPPE
jgi:hypothetical protein